MGRYRKTRHIEAPPAAVFRAFTDAALVADWMEADRIVDQRGPLDEVGSTYTLVIRGPWRFRMRVTRARAAREYGLEGRGPLGTSYRLDATLLDQGLTTELVVEAEWTLPLGPVGRWIDRRWVEPGSQGEEDRELDRLVDIVTGHDERSPRVVVRGGRRRRELAAELERARGVFLEPRTPADTAD